MFLSSRKARKFYIHFVIAFITCAFIIDKLFIDERNFRKNIPVQNYLLNYNDDQLRTRWPFKISRYYNVNDLRTYKSKPRILAQFDLPGELGEFKSLDTTTAHDSQKTFFSLIEFSRNTRCFATNIGRVSQKIVLRIPARYHCQ